MKEEVMKKVREHHQEALNNGYIVFGTFLNGSQNYALDTPDSDVDTRTIVIPSLKSIYLNKSAVSTTHILKDGSHNDVKDIRLAVREFLKQNINVLEILFTKYFVIDPFFEEEHKELRSMAEEITHINKNQFINCAAGMAMGKYREFGLITKENKNLYNGKKLSHIIRIEETLARFLYGESFKDSLIPCSRDLILHAKKEKLSYSAAKELADRTMKNIEELKEKFLEKEEKNNEETVEKLLKLSFRIMEKSFKREIDERGK